MNKLKERTQKKSPQSGILWIVFMFLLGLILRTLYLNRSLGGGDENQYLLDYSQASFNFITHTYFLGGHHVFYTILMRLLIMLFGDENAIAIRFPGRDYEGNPLFWQIFVFIRNHTIRRVPNKY